MNTNDSYNNESVHIINIIKTYINQLLIKNRFQMDEANLHMLKDKVMKEILSQADVYKYLAQRNFVITKTEALVLMGAFNFVRVRNTIIDIEVNSSDNLEQIEEFELQYSCITSCRQG